VVLSYHHKKNSVGNFKSSGMLRFVSWLIVIDVSGQLCAFIFIVNIPYVCGLLESSSRTLCNPPLSHVSLCFSLFEATVGLKFGTV
jgi:hypothetical protein